MTKTLLFIFLFTISYSFSQKRVIEGKVILTDLQGMPGVNIYSSENKPIGTTDINGNFKIDVTENTSFLKFGFIGMYDEIVQLNPNCNYAQVILFEEITHCFMSEKKNLRLYEKDRKAKNKAIPKLLNKAVTQKIFDEDRMCNQQEIIK